MPFISYSPDLEDVLIKAALPAISHGFYIDVGPGHPVDRSATRGLYMAGWRGLHVVTEPFAEPFRRDRADDRILTVREGSESMALWRQISGEVAAPVQLLRMDLTNGWVSVVGAELALMQPWIVLVRWHRTPGEISGSEGWARVIVAAGYDAVRDDGRNRFFVARTQADLAALLSRPEPLISATVVLMTSDVDQDLINRLQVLEAKVAEARVALARAKELVGSAEQRAAAHRRKVSGLEASLARAQQDVATLRIERGQLRDAMSRYELNRRRRRATRLEEGHRLMDKGAAAAPAPRPVPAISRKLRTAVGAFRTDPKTLWHLVRKNFRIR